MVDRDGFPASTKAWQTVAMLAELVMCETGQDPREDPTFCSEAARTRSTLLHCELKVLRDDGVANLSKKDCHGDCTASRPYRTARSSTAAAASNRERVLRRCRCVVLHRP